MIWHFNFDPVAFHLFGLAIHWYGICFATGVSFAIFLAERDPEFNNIFPSVRYKDKFFGLLVISLLLGAKLGYLFIYTPSHSWLDNLLIPRGFSFHGALVGIIVFVIAWTKLYKVSFYRLADLLAYYTPLGLLFGRIGNFLNSELWGRPTESATYGVVFERTDRLLLPRHPSQLYEALGEGLCLFLFMIVTRRYLKEKGEVFAYFLMGYGVIRGIIEQWRQPDAHMGFVLMIPQAVGIALASFFVIYQVIRLLNKPYPVRWSFIGSLAILVIAALFGRALHVPLLLTMGQVLCLGMVAGGLVIQMTKACR